MTDSKTSKKSPSASKSRGSKASLSSPGGSSAPTSHATPAMVHDLRGFALIGLPPELRSILGDEALRRNALEIQSLVITAIVREPAMVVYVNLPVMVKEIERPGDAQTRNGMVLKDITGPALKKKTRKPNLPSPTNKRSSHA